MNEGGHIPSHEVFNVDWTNKDAVCLLARRLGKGMTVFIRDGSKTYSITHTSRVERYEQHEVVLQT